MLSRPGATLGSNIASGSIELNRKLLREGDGAAISHETTLRMVATSAAEVLVFDLP